jgi:hypothetical protein
MLQQHVSRQQCGPFLLFTPTLTAIIHLAKAKTDQDPTSQRFNVFRECGFCCESLGYHKDNVGGRRLCTHIIRNVRPGCTPNTLATVHGEL